MERSSACGLARSIQAAVAGSVTQYGTASACAIQPWASSVMWPTLLMPVPTTMSEPCILITCPPRMWALATIVLIVSYARLAFHVMNRRYRLQSAGYKRWRPGMCLCYHSAEHGRNRAIGLHRDLTGRWKKQGHMAGVSPLYTHVGEVIRRYRQVAGLTQEELAERAEVGVRVV